MREQPWALAKAAKAGDEARPRRAWRGVLGDLLEACRLVALAARRSCRRPRRACSRSSATRTRTRADGNGGPPILDELRLGAHAAEAGRLGAPEPLFPRLRRRRQPA